MLGLTLREEFRGKRLKGTAIELSNDQHTGATQIAAQQFLEITYPTHDLLKGIEAVGPSQGRPVVVIGERGLGKSHLMAALYHAVTDPASTSSWLNAWSTTLADANIGKIALRDGMHVIGESLHRHRYKFLWDVLFENHPHGTYIKGKWEGQGTSKTEIPSDKLIIELLENKPTMLLLDEFQTWYDGLTNTKQYPWKNWAFNFIQILSEIAKERPDLLVLVPAFLRAITPVMQQLGGDGIDWLALFGERGDDLLAAVSIAIGKPRAWVDDLAADEAILLAAKVIEVNADFFTRTVMPKLDGLFAQASTVAAAATAGSTPSST